MPTDLLGITPATYEADRQDGNYVAALRPACNRIRRAVLELGKVTKVTDVIEKIENEDANSIISDPDDCITLIESWMGKRPMTENKSGIRYSDVDRELGLESGAARKYIEEAAKKWDYEVERKGKDYILFRDGSQIPF